MSDEQHALCKWRAWSLEAVTGMERKEEEEEKEEEGKLWTSSPGDDGRVGKTRTMTIVIGE